MMPPTPCIPSRRRFATGVYGRGDRIGQFVALHFVANGTSRHCATVQQFGRFSNRPFRVKHLQTVPHHLRCRCLSRARASLRNRHKALPLWSSMTRWNNLSGGLAVRRMAGPSDLTNSPHPSSREGHLSTVWRSSSVLLLHLILRGCHAATTSRVQRNTVPSTHMRCRITASRRASATIAFFIPRCLAICIAQALSQDHLLVRVSMTWAAS
jgi:hypothetical protein